MRDQEKTAKLSFSTYRMILIEKDTVNCHENSPTIETNPLIG